MHGTVLLAALLEQPSVAPHPRGLITLFQSTGFVGPLLMLLGALAVLAAVRRWLELRPASLAPEPLQASLELALRDGKVSAALAQATASRTCLGTVVAAGLQLHAAGLDEMLANVERTALRESLRLANRIANLARFGLVILLIGVLGTVLGLVNTLRVLELLVAPGLGHFVAGAAESLTCTAFGLALALLCFCAYFMLQSRLAQRTLAVREIAEELMLCAASRTGTPGR